MSSYNCILGTEKLSVKKKNFLEAGEKFLFA